MKDKDMIEFEEQTKDMSLENKMKYAKLYFEMKRSMKFDWGFFFIIVGLCLMAFAYTVKLLIDIGVLTA